MRDIPVTREASARSLPSLPTSLQEWWSYCFYETAFFLCATGMTLGFSYRSAGMRNVPREGPVLFIANHQSFLDPVLIGLAVRRHLSYLARKSLFDHPAFAWLIRMLNAVAIDQEGLGIDGLRAVLRLLKEGKAVVVFPEGTRTDKGEIMPLQPGIQLLIKKTRAPIVPVGIAGAFEAWPNSRPCPIPAPLFMPPGKGTIACVVGKPLDAERFVEMPRAQLLTELYAELRREQEWAERLRRK